MWTPFVWLSEAVTNPVYESIAVPNFCQLLRGTPFCRGCCACWLSDRRGVVLDTTDVTEYDCVRISDGSVLNARSGLQTHLFEDRVMKIGRWTLARRCWWGAHHGVVRQPGGDGAAGAVVAGDEGRVPSRRRANGTARPKAMDAASLSVPRWLRCAEHAPAQVAAGETLLLPVRTAGLAPALAAGNGCARN